MRALRQRRLVGSYVAGGKSFKPTDISGLKLWLDASQITGKNDGDSISSWNDFSGNSNHATQSTGSLQPLYKTGIKNGKPAVLFDGVDDILATGTGLAGGAKTIFVVGYFAGTNVYIRAVSALPDATIFLGVGATLKLATFLGDGTTWNDVTENSPSTAWASNWRIVAMDTDGTTLTPYVDGSAMTTKNGANANASTSITVGGIGVLGPFQYWKTYLAEIIAYDSGLSPANVGLVNGYLNSKWAVY